MDAENFIVLKELNGNTPPQLNALQKFLEPHVEEIVALWVILWCATALIMLSMLIRSYVQQTKRAAETTDTSL